MANDLHAVRRPGMSQWLGMPAIDIGDDIFRYKAGRLPVDRMPGEKFLLDHINEGFDHLATGGSVRDAIVF